MLTLRASADRRDELLLWAGLVFACSALDGLATLALMGRGYGEANPAMQPLVAFGPVFFLVGKQAWTAAALEPLRWLRNRLGRRRTRRVLLGLVLAYLVLLLYEAALLLH